MSSTLDGGPPLPSEPARYCRHCHTPVEQTGPASGHPDGLLLSTVYQRMRHRSICPGRLLVMGCAQPHEAGPDGWIPDREFVPPVYTPQQIGPCGPPPASWRSRSAR